jgi:hypothetical protein
MSQIVCLPSGSTWRLRLEVPHAVIEVQLDLARVAVVILDRIWQLGVRRCVRGAVTAQV